MTLCRYTLFCLCSTFWPLKSWLWSHIHLTCAVLPLVTSSCFWEWSHSCETIVTRMSVKFKISHWPYNMQLSKKVGSDSVSSSGRSARPVAWTQDRCTFKGITMTHNRGKHMFCYHLSPVAFGYACIIFFGQCSIFWKSLLLSSWEWKKDRMLWYVYSYGKVLAHVVETYGE